jgi:hypothetical protein
MKVRLIKKMGVPQILNVIPVFALGLSLSACSAVQEELPPSPDGPRPTGLSAVIADSVEDFSNEQGESQWYYGYFEDCRLSLESDCHLDFIPFVNFYEDHQWWGTSVHGTPGYTITLLSSEMAHPSSPVDSQPLLGNFYQSAVRRWISAVAENVIIEAEIKMPEDANVCGDGVTAYILVDGMKFFEISLASGDTTGVSTQIPVALNRGSQVDFVVEPNVNPFCDTTHFTSVIRTAPNL